MQLQADAQNRAAQVAKSFFVPQKYSSPNPPRANGTTSNLVERVDSWQASEQLSCASPRSPEESTQEYGGWIDESATTATYDFSLSNEDL